MVPLFKSDKVEEAISLMTESSVCGKKHRIKVIIAYLERAEQRGSKKQAEISAKFYGGRYKEGLLRGAEIAENSGAEDRARGDVLLSVKETIVDLIRKEAE